MGMRNKSNISILMLKYKLLKRYRTINPIDIIFKDNEIRTPLFKLRGSEVFITLTKANALLRERLMHRIATRRIRKRLRGITMAKRYSELNIFEKKIVRMSNRRYKRLLNNSNRTIT